MNWLDFVIIIFLIVSIISGIANGLIKSLFSLVGFIVGIVLAGRFYISLANHLTFISSERAAQIVAFIFIFIVVIAIASLLGWLFTKIISATPLGIFNRILGGVFGLVTGAIFIALLLTLWAHYADPVGAISDSTLARFLLDKFPIVLNLLPNEFDTVRNFFQ
jgi:membrane protein required for colicin V production